MADEAVPATSPPEWPVKPRHLLLFALAAAGLGVVLAFPTGMWVPLRILVLSAGILAAGVTVTLRPKEPLVLAGAALVALLSAWGMDGSQIQLWVRGLPDVPPGSDAYPDWDSARLVMH